MPTYEFWPNLATVGVPFGAYFIGIIIRKVALPGENSPKLSQQLLLGIPFSLVIISPLLIVFQSAATDVSAYLFTLGIIVEHGMIVNETAAKHLQALIKNSSGPPPAMAAGV